MTFDDVTNSSVFERYKEFKDGREDVRDDQQNNKMVFVGNKTFVREVLKGARTLWCISETCQTDINYRGINYVRSHQRQRHARSNERRANELIIYLSATAVSYQHSFTCDPSARCPFDKQYLYVCRRCLFCIRIESKINYFRAGVCVCVKCNTSKAGLLNNFTLILYNSIIGTRRFDRLTARAINISRLIIAPN